MAANKSTCYVSRGTARVQACTQAAIYLVESDSTALCSHAQITRSIVHCSRAKCWIPLLNL